VAKNVHSADKVATDRRAKAGQRRSGDRRQKDAPVVVERRKLERRVKVSRRRQIDPTTCEREYTDDELQFMQALEIYKRTSGRMFPTCSEVLEVIKGLGYSKNALPSAETSPNPPIAVSPAVTASPSGESNEWAELAQ
jgi:hypothetical protein